MNFDMWFSKAIIGVSISAAVAAGIYYTRSAWCLWALMIIVMVYQNMGQKRKRMQRVFNMGFAQLRGSAMMNGTPLMDVD